MELRLDSLSVTAGGARLVERLSLTAGSGEVLGLVGPNGSGKSTALRCVYRALRPTGGAVRVGGDSLWELTPRDAARRVAALTQEGGADFDFTVAELVALGRTPYRQGNQPLTADEQRLCHEAMARMDVLHLAHRGVLELSGGERQRVLVARALAQRPQVLVLDEPTNHLDIRHQVELLGQLRGSGLTVLVVLHDLNLAAAACDRIGVLDRGRLVATGPPAEVLTERLIAEVFGVRAALVRHPLTGDPQILFTLGEPRPAAPEPAGPEHAAAEPAAAGRRCEPGHPEAGPEPGTTARPPLPVADLPTRGTP